MSASIYLIAIPLGVIAVSGWLVKVENDSFRRGQRTSEIQQIANHRLGRVAGPQAEVPAAARLDHQRFGWEMVPEAAGGRLGDDFHRRPLGARAASAVPWLDRQEVALARQEAAGLPDIPGYQELPAPAVPEFETVLPGSGFHITADEATKLDLKKETVTFNGGVKLVSPQFHLTSDRLVIHLGKDKKTFRLLEASGSVHVQLTGVPEEKKYRGQSGFAVYDPAKAVLTLTQWPKIQGSGQELIAAEADTRVFLHPKTGHMHTEGRAQSRVA